MTILAENSQESIHNLLRDRRSIRAFSSEPIEPEKLKRLFEAARWAPSSANQQPWRFIVATKDRPDDFDRLLSVIKEGNVVWARHAPALILTVANRIRERDQSENRHAFHDVGQAVAHLTVQAQADGLYLRQMGGFDQGLAREVFEIPIGFDPVTAIAIGYPAAQESIPDSLREREAASRVRRPLSEIVYEGTWGNSRW